MYSGMTKDEAIAHIKTLYPPDDEFEETAKIGKKIIEQAKEICNHWENLPEDVLVTAARLMMEMQS